MPQLTPVSAATVSTIVANGLMFNATWLAIVLTHSAALAPVFVFIHLVAHFFFIGKGVMELKLIIGVCLFGFAIDQLLFLAGIFNINGSAALAPLWLSCLWPVLASTLLHAFSGLQHRLLLASALGALGASSSYLAGARLTDVNFSSPLWGPLAIGVIWALLFPLLIQFARAMSVRQEQNNA